MNQSQDQNQSEPQARLLDSGKMFVQRHWLIIAIALILIGGVAVGQPAWAAPGQSPNFQTVPNPTPTPEADDDIGEPTPIPDDDDDDDSEEPTADGSSEEPLDETVEEDTLQLFAEPSSVEVQAGEAAFIAVVSVAQLNVRAGSGTGFDVVGTLVQDDEVEVIFRSQDDSWWYICCATSTGAEGWISSDLVEPLFPREQSVDLLPVFGTEQEQTEPVAGPNTATTEDNTVSAASVAAADSTQTTSDPGLDMTITLAPPYAWQGQTTRIEFLISNPNNEDAVNVELGDELPSTLEYLGSESSVNGVVSEEPTESGGMLILIRWPLVPAGSSVTASIDVRVAENVADGTVIDNLAAVRAENSGRTTGGISIGMPPTTLPLFQ